MAFRPTTSRFASQAWLARQARDPYVKQRAAVGGASDLRSRSAFKLLEMNDQFKFLDHSDVLSIVDLGAAPGGWSQLLSSKLGWSAEFSVEPVSRAKKEPKTFAEGDKYGRDKLASGSKPKKWWQTEEHMAKYAEEEEEEEPVKFETRSRSKRRQLLLQLQEKERSKSKPGWNPEGESSRSKPDPTEMSNLKIYRRRNGETFVETPPPPPPKGSDPLDIFNDTSEDHTVGRGTILAVDLLRMKPVPGVITMQLDFLKPESSALVHATMAKNNPEGKVDVILSDMASNFSGNPVHDVESSLRISEAVWEFTKRNLRTSKDIGRKRGGVLLLKHFTHPHLDEFRIQHLEPHFAEVRFIKPKASRAESGEGYWLCSGWKGVESLTFGLKIKY